MEKTKALGQVSTIVTFDQPLYLKAREIVASCPEKFQHVVVRLGGFHLAMSFMGAIGYVMEGSGLVELFNRIYAVNSTTKIMTGHSYARAIRAHYLAHRTLAQLILQTITDISPELHKSVEELLDGDRQEILTSSAANKVKELSDTFGAKLLELSERGKTPQLWIQYFQQVTLLKQLIESERRGDWDLHLRTIYNMLPYFHSSGHFLYAKCAHLYLQDMMGLQITMPADEYVNFTGGGAFTVRRSDKLWCGTFTDQTIEQFLMRSTKIEGGFRMRNISDSLSFRGLQGHTSMIHITEEVEKFSGVHFVNSEQHVDSRDSRVRRDHTDSIKMLKWLEGHYPFTDTKQLISISTGIVGDESINCHQAKDLGEAGVARIVGKDFKSVKFKRNERVKQLSMMHSGVKIHGNEVTVNPTTLYHRMIIVKQSEEELKEFLNYELSPYPTSMFEEGSMRKGTKSSLYKAFDPLPESGIPKDTVHVMDGGFLLHRVVWSKNQNFDQICDSYVRYLKHHYNKPIVIFDGYPENSRGTKQVERVRRATKKHSVEVMFDREMIPNASQEHFLGNEKNKSRFITILMETLTAAKIPTKQAEEDADRLIVTTAIDISLVYQTVTVVGEDVDLIVLLVGLSAPENVFFLKPGRGKLPSHWYSPKKLVHERISHNILFLHAVTGCDTTSSLYGQGKAKSLKVLEKHPELSVALQPFKTPFQDCQLDTTLSAGEKFIAAFYGDQHGNSSLNEMRYQLYKSAVFKSSTHLESLPPTQDAARQHLLRVYLQIQLWLGHKQEPENFGWKKTPNGVEPIKTTLPPAPDTLLSIIACKFKRGCSSKACGCKKAGLFCSRLCLNCGDTTCSNIELDNTDDDFDNDDELDPQSSLTGNEDKEKEEIPEPERTNKKEHQPHLEESEPGPSTAVAKRHRLK